MQRIAALAASLALVSGCATSTDRYAGGGGLAGMGLIATTVAATYHCPDRSDEFLGNMGCNLDKGAAVTLGITTIIIGLALIATAPAKARHEQEEADIAAQQAALAHRGPFASGLSPR